MDPYFGLNRIPQIVRTVVRKAFPEKLFRTFVAAKNGRVLTASAWAFVLISTFVALFALPQVRSTHSVTQFLPKSHPLVLQDRVVRKNYGLEEQSNLILMVRSRTQKNSFSWLETKNFQQLKNLSEKIEGLPGVNQVTSLANLNLVHDDKSNLRFGTLDEILPASKWKSFVASQPALTPNLLSNDSQSSLILIQAQSNDPNSILRIENKINKLMSRNFQHLQASLTGVPTLQAHLSVQLTRELLKSFLWCLAIFCLGLLLFYKNFQPLLAAAVALILINIIIIGSLAWMGLPFTLLSATLPVILSTTVVSLLVHTLHFQKQHSSKNEKSTSLDALNILRELALPHFLGALTTAVGFFVLAWTDIPIIRSYAFVVSGAVMGVWFFMQPILYLSLVSVSATPRDWSFRPAHWTLFGARKSLFVIPVSLAVAAFLAAQSPQINFSTRLFNDLPSTDPNQMAADFADQIFGGSQTAHFELTAPKGQSWRNPKQLHKLQKSLTEIRKQKHVGQALSVVDFLNLTKRTDKSLLDEQIFLFSMGKSDPLKHFWNSSIQRGRILEKLRIEVRFHDKESKLIESEIAKIRQILNRQFPQTRLEVSGLAVMGHVLNKTVSHELIYGFWQSLFLVGVFLIFVFRSLKWALIACIPNLLPPAALMGVLALSQTPVKPGLALIFSIAMGLAFNNTLYILSRLRELSKKVGYPFGLRETLLTEGNPCLGESTLSVLGFSVFLLSQFPLNQQFGFFMCVSILVAAWGDLVLLPALLKEFPEFLATQKSANRVFEGQQNIQEGYGKSNLSSN